MRANEADVCQAAHGLSSLGRTSGPPGALAQVPWSESASGACTPAFILFAGASVSDSDQQTQWEELEWFTCPLTCVLSIVWQDLTDGVLATGIRDKLGLIFK